MAAKTKGSWQVERLENICAHITDGKHGDCKGEPGSGFYFLSCKDIANGNLNYDSAREITEVDFLDTHRRTKLAPSDILITNSGTIGRMALARDCELTRRTTFQKSVAILKPIVSRVEPSFLYYAIHSDIDRLIEFAGGTAQKNLLLRDLRAYEVRVPPLRVQRRIASVLSAYDDLIANNAQRIKILEEMAQAIYREWFVEFSSPDIELRKATPEEQKLIGKDRFPEGWDIKRLGDMAEVQWGDTSTTKASYVEDGYDAYSASGLDGKLDHYDYDREGIVVSAIGANCGLTWYARGKWSCIKNTIRFWSKNEKSSTEFLYFATLGKAVWPRRGAAQPFISQGDALKMRILQPNRSILEEFTRITRDMLQQIAVLEKKNANLRGTRDLLLPKLISGEVGVDRIETTI